MIDPQLLAYIKRELLAGTSREIITSNLKTQGWTDVDINEVFGSISVQTLQSSSVPITAAAAHSSKKILFSIIIVILVGGGIFAYTKFMPTPTDNNQQDQTDSTKTTDTVATQTAMQPLSEKKYNYYVAFAFSDDIASVNFDLNGLPYFDSLAGADTQPTTLDSLIENGLNIISVTVQAEEGKTFSDTSGGTVHIVRTDKGAPVIGFTSDISKASPVKEYTVGALSGKDTATVTFDFPVESNIVFPWTSGKIISDTPETKNALMAKYRELWDAFNAKDKQKIMTLIKKKNDFYTAVLGDPTFTDAVSGDLDASFEDKDRPLYQIAPDKYLRLVIIAHGKLATISVEKDSVFSPIFYYGKNGGGSTSYPYYFMLNQDGQFEIVY